MRSLALVLLPALALLTGCGTLPNQRGWGEDALVPLPTFERVAKSAARAAIDPMTWAPALGCAVLGLKHNDRKVSNWAIERTPVFGSNESARRASDWLLAAGFAEALAITLATPSGSETEDWMLSKLRGVAVEAGAFFTVTTLTSSVKLAVDRRRPLGSAGDGFPSGHTASAFTCATLASKNLDSIEMPGGLRFGLQAGTYALAAATAWGRIEAGKHFPSDVLASIAISHFLTAFIHDAFMGLDVPDIFGLELDLSRDGGGIALSFRF